MLRREKLTNILLGVSSALWIVNIIVSILRNNFELFVISSAFLSLNFSTELCAYRYSLYQRAYRKYVEEFLKVVLIKAVNDKEDVKITVTVEEGK